MGLYYKNSAIGQRGNAAAETGIQLETFSVTYRPPFKDKKVDYKGEVIGWAMTDQLSKDIRIAGRVITATTSGLMAVVFSVAVTLANSIDDFLAVTSGDSDGGVYFDEITIDSSNEGWRMFNGSASVDPLVA